MYILWPRVSIGKWLIITETWNPKCPPVGKWGNDLPHINKKEMCHHHWRLVFHKYLISGTSHDPGFRANTCCQSVQMVKTPVVKMVCVWVYIFTYFCSFGDWDKIHWVFFWVIQLWVVLYFRNFLSWVYVCLFVCQEKRANITEN